MVSPLLTAAFSNASLAFTLYEFQLGVSPGRVFSARECWQLNCQSSQTGFAGARWLAVWHRKQFECGACVVFAHARHNLGDRGHHDYDPTDVCVCMPDPALTDVSAESEGAWCEFICLSVRGGPAGTHGPPRIQCHRLADRSFPFISG
jgi:hypothetical protein